jgi:peptidoglycan/LPS O-acetylase OafA/YrhL
MFNHIHVRIPPWVVAYLGVDVFYVLSGFLITTLMLREDEKTGRISLKAFYTRRVLRIVPVYYFTILLYFFAVHFQHDVARIAEYKIALPWLLTFMAEYRPLAAGNLLGHAWTLAIEEKFYIFWPLLVVLLLPFRGRKVLPLFLLPIVVSFFRWPLNRSYEALLIGATLAIALSTKAHWAWVRRMPAVPDAVLLLFVAVTYVLNGLTRHYSTLFDAAVALMIASLVLRRGLLRSALENRVLVFVGRRSYALYLVHVLMLDATETYLARWTHLKWLNVMAVAFSLSLALASAMHVAIEVPCIAVGRRLSRRFAHSEPVSQAVS